MSRMCNQVYLLALFGIATASAHATQIVSSSTGLSGAHQTVTFSELVIPPFIVLSDQYSAFGVTFTGGPFFNGVLYNSPFFDPAVPPDGARPDVSNCAPDIGCNLTQSINFASPVSGAAFDFAGQFGAPFIFSAFRGATQVDQITVTLASMTPNGVDGWGYFGFTGETFDSIHISAINPASTFSGLAFAMDNLQTAAAVPEPSTLLLGSAALIILAISRRFFGKKRLFLHNAQ